MSSNEITDEELDSLTNSLKIRYGIDFTNYEKKSLKRGFGRLIMKHRLGSLLGLWSKILKDREFVFNCIDDLTVNLTELFRNPEVWMKIQDQLMPELKMQSEIKIWHAGCSTGEEVYTMIVVLDQVQAYSKARILATDLSQQVLEKAKEGNFPGLFYRKYKTAFDHYIKKGHFDDYFEHNEDHLKVREKYRRNIRFVRHNLVQDPMNEQFDLIFCRNVMIYFDENLKKKVLQQFCDKLKPGGYFVIGYYDMMPDESKELFDLYDPTTRIYRKK